MTTKKTGRLRTDKVDLMASYSITERKGKHSCQVRWFLGDGKKLKTQAKTFTKKVTAEAWGRQRVEEIEQGVLGGGEHTTLRKLIDMYLNDSYVEVGRSKRYSLKMIMDCDIGLVRTEDLKAKDIVDFCKDRKSAGAGRPTVAVDVSNLRSVLKAAEALYDVSIDESAIVKAMATLHTLKLIGKGEIRSRRPAEDEIIALKEKLLERQEKRGSIIPFVDILDFSILSCMRIGEVCKITWEDLNEDEGWVWVRDRKDPRKKEGNHMKVPLLGGALDIVLKQKKTDDPRIFPFNERSVTAGFQRVRNALGIKDLRYHDLRREGASRLFEKGYPIDKVAQVTGHRDLNTLWRVYTSVFPDRLIEG